MMAALIEKLTTRRKAATKGYGDARRALSELRELGAKLRDERAGLEARVVPLNEAQDAAARAVMRAAEAALDDINLASLTRPEDGRAPRLDLTETRRDALAFAAQVESITAMLNARLADRYERLGLEGIAADEKAAALAKIDADLLAAECAEEAVIRDLEREGAGPLRRPDADPRALLAHESELK